MGELKPVAPSPGRVSYGKGSDTNRALGSRLGGPWRGLKGSPPRATCALGHILGRSVRAACGVISNRFTHSCTPLSLVRARTRGRPRPGDGGEDLGEVSCCLPYRRSAIWLCAAASGGIVEEMNQSPRSGCCDAARAGDAPGFGSGGCVKASGRARGSGWSDSRAPWPWSRVCAVRGCLWTAGVRIAGHFQDFGSLQPAWLVACSATCADAGRVGRERFRCVPGTFGPASSLPPLKPGLFHPAGARRAPSEPTRWIPGCGGRMTRDAWSNA